jgi:hypothetical protein
VQQKSFAHAPRGARKSHGATDSFSLNRLGAIIERWHRYLSGARVVRDRRGTSTTIPCENWKGTKMTHASFLLGIGALLAMTGIASGQSSHSMICGARDHIVAQLTTRYGEQVRSIGLAPRNRIIEVFASEETGSWTITITSADGTTCLMASGQHFELLPLAPRGEPL